MEEKQNEWSKRELGALWKRKGRNQDYYTGKVGEQQVVIFANRNKQEGSNQPDLRVYKSEPRNQEQGSQSNSQEAVTQEEELI